MNKLNEYDIQFLIEKLQKGEGIPEDYKYKLFPVKQKEYELVYAGKMRKEDILANEDGVFPVPLQVEKVFNGEEYPSGDNDWRNMIVFGDNLQFLKTVYENKDPLIKNKVKGKVKLIYIDPPFATEGDFKSNQGQKAYTDKAKGADFIEFLRRRLVVAKEFLSSDGCILVHLDFRYKHHIKVIMDEIFGEYNFKNEIIANRIKKNVKEREKVKKLNEEFDTILLYSKSEESKILPPTRNDFKHDRWHGFDAAGYRKGMDYDLFGHKPNSDRHWHWTEDKARVAEKNYKKWNKEFSQKEALGDYCRRHKQEGIELQFVRSNPRTTKPEYFIPSSDESLCNNMWNDITVSTFEYDYPTEKSEKLLKRIIEAITDTGDIVVDFFAGSGTTAAVSEKLNRRWIACDIGKLAFYTMQKRILTVENSKDLKNPKKKYNKKAKSFISVNTGLYDLKKVFELKKDDYINFVTNLFEVEPINKKISGIKIDGQKKDGYYVLVYPYWQFRNASVDEEYLEDLHSHIGSKIGERLYIIAPANYVDFISDYHEIGKTRYYFLKVPYQIIKELHKVQFKKFRQPQSKRNVNDLDDAVGFHFIRQPEVEARFIKNGKNAELQITKFLSNYLEEETGSELDNFESLAMVLIDKDYNSKEFVMDEFYFAEDLLPEKKEDETEDQIKKELKHLKKISIPMNKEDCGDRIMAVYVDIYGNEFKEVLSLKK